MSPWRLCYEEVSGESEANIPTNSSRSGKLIVCAVNFDKSQEIIFTIFGYIIVCEEKANL